MVDSKVQVVGEAEDMMPPEVKTALTVIRKYAADPEKLAELKKRLETARAQVNSLRDQMTETRALVDNLESEIETMEKRAEMIDEIEGKEDED